MQKYQNEHSLDKTADEAPGKDGMISTAFNHARMGRPFAGRLAKQIAGNDDKYNMFGSEGVGEHFGRSGSPKGGSPKI